jgi:hypothetical protein
MYPLFKMFEHFWVLKIVEIMDSKLGIPTLQLLHWEDLRQTPWTR